MQPADFDGSNAVMNEPRDMTLDQCEVLNVQMGVMPLADGSSVPAVLSCWKPSQGELEIIKETGRVWLAVCGRGMPPVVVTGYRPEII